MAEHQHGPQCSHPPDATHHAAPQPPADEKADPTPFTHAFKYAAIGGIILFVALMLPLPGDWQTKKVLIIVGTIAGIALFPLAYVAQNKK